MQDALGHKVIIDNKFIHCINCGATIGIANKSMVDNKVTLDFSRNKNMDCPKCGVSVR